jgi:NADPH:quinone reductase-like Zn-dependent oxidoreductase
MLSTRFLRHYLFQRRAAESIRHTSIQKVAAFSKMGTAQKYGAYAEYTVAPGEPCLGHAQERPLLTRTLDPALAVTTFPLGPKTSFEEAATVPLAAMTAAIGLFIKLGIPEPDESGDLPKVTDPEPILIWGASSSVGSFAVQLAKKAGLFV